MSIHIRGRRRSLDQKKKAELCALVARGLSVEEAADDLNVSERTVQREARRDEDFDHELKLARRAPPDPLQAMQTAARAHWRAAAWLLERSDPENYGRRPASAASPRQFETALAAVLEAALEATEPDRRKHVYDRVQAACDQAFKNLFPAYGPCGRRLVPAAPRTPLADAQHLDRLRNPPPHLQIADYDDDRAAHDAVVDESPPALPRPTAAPPQPPAPPAAPPVAIPADGAAPAPSVRRPPSPPILSPKMCLPTDCTAIRGNGRRESPTSPDQAWSGLFAASTPPNAHRSSTNKPAPDKPRRR